MKHGLKKRILSLVLCISMVLPMAAVPMPVYSVENEESIAPLSNPFTPETIITLPDGTTTKSQSYRIPSMVTLADGTIVAAADIRWNTTFDGGGLDTLVARSTDGGANWSYTVANYLGDNGNVYNGGMSTTFIDPNLLVAADGQTVYMLVDLYAYGVALNGDDSRIQPVADTGFDANGNLKLSNNNHSSYDYYLKDGKIYNSSNQVEEGYTVDPYFNITYTQKGETKQSNLFFADSPFKVARTQYLYLTKSSDGGATWSEPNLLDVRAKAKVAATENALLVSPGNSITTSGGIMVYPVYSYITDGTQHVALIYSTDGVNWMRSSDYTTLNWSSEGAIVELENGNIRVFVRNKTKHLCYVDFDVRTMTWIGHTDTGVPTNSNTQLSAITYSKTSNGDQVVLISCPTGPNGAGSDNNDGSMRTNGKIHVFTVNATGEMTLQNTVNVFENLATGALSDNYTETKGFFAYSSLTERADGSVALLYENNQFGWGASGSNGNGTYNPENVKTYYTITAKTFDWFELLYGDVSEEAKSAYEKLMDTDLIEEFEVVYATISEAELAALQQETKLWSAVAEHKSLLVYDHFYSTVSESEFNAVKEKYPQEYAYIQNEPELKYFNDQILERVKYLDQHPEDRYVQFGDVEYVELPSYTNVAPLVKPVVNTRLRSRATTGTFALTKNAVTAANDADNGVVLDKNVTKNDDGTYTVRLEAYTTGQTVTTVTEKEMPADIILVLDLSSSMTSNSMAAVGYQQITNATALQGADFANAENLFVMVNGEYRDVTVTGSGETTETKEKQYSGTKTITAMQSYLNSGKKLYCKHSSNGNVHYNEIQITQSNGWYYISCSEQQHARIFFGNSTVPGNLVLYESIGGVAYEKYEYSYVNEANQTVTITYNANDSIVGGSNPAYYRKVSDGTITRAEALVNAVTIFANQVAQKAKGKDGQLGTEDDVAHSVAIVGFSGNSSDNTGIYIGDTVYKYSGTGENNASSVYGTALQNMSTVDGVNNINASIGKLTNSRNTYTHVGTEMAEGILAAQPADRYVKDGETIRSKVVVIFTDGAPNNYDSPVDDCYRIKNTYNATVYSVGILEGGDASLPAPTGNVNNAQLNRFMHAMSSNYKYATSSSNLGTLTNDRYAVDGSNYYLLASNADDLNNIFTSISSSATSGGSITDLSTETQIRDIISPYFQLPENANLNSINIYSAEYQGGDNWGEAVALTAATPTISTDRKVIGVTGFDYKENWVGTATDANGNVTYHGQKLIIEFPIEVDPDFLGGSNVVTNGDTSGIYESATATTPIEKFEVPDVDVELREISTVVQDKHIYLSNTVDLTSLLNLYVKRDDQNTDLRVTVDGVNNAYVNLEYTITLDDETVAVYTIPLGSEWDDGSWDIPDDKVALLRDYLATKDTPFTVTCVMTDAANSSNQSQASDSANVYVYKPTVTFQDATKIPNSESVDYAKDNFVSVVWLHGTTEATPSTVEGTEPTLTYTYVPESNCVGTGGLVIAVNEFHVDVTEVWSNDINIIGSVTFVHTPCDGGCGFDYTKGEFMIHLPYTTLTITKVTTDGAGNVVDYSTIDPNQTFIFNISGDDVNLDVTVHRDEDGNWSTTIDGLTIGKTYTITEKTEWSWRYICTGWNYDKDSVDNLTGGKTATITLGQDGTITYTNSRSIIWWLDGDSWCNNIFGVPKG